jgi:hypothetical protein
MVGMVWMIGTVNVIFPPASSVTTDVPEWLLLLELLLVPFSECTSALVALRLELLVPDSVRLSVPD